MVRVVSAWMLVNGLLLAPEWISAALSGGFPPPWISVEAGLVVGGMALIPRRRWTPVLVWIVAAGLVLGAAATFADLVFWFSLGRPLNLSLDLYLLDAVYRLAVGNSGLLRTLIGMTAIIVAAVLLTALLAWLLTPREERAVRKPALGIVAATLVAMLLGEFVDPVGTRLRASVTSLARTQAGLLLATRRERELFAADLARPSELGAVDAPFARLEGRNVVMGYIESYGMAALEDPEFRAVTLPVLGSTAERFDSAGLHVVSGRMVSPTLGGQSWYAHGTVLSGLWLANQQRYELLIRSDRRTLVDDFERAGYRTATVMPAITTVWPEAVRLGYEEVHTAASMPYGGPPFYWVTMPDQYTWSFVGERLREATGPLFVETGMVSSHAPWTPILPLLDWDEIGDGAAFEPFRLEGHPPEELWWDVVALRAGYAPSIRYSLEAMAQFAERFVDERTLLIVFGDHQAAPWVTGADGPDVPVHVIARDASVLEPFLDWGFTPGTLPPASGPVHRMDEFREWFVRAYSGTPSTTLVGDR